MGVVCVVVFFIKGKPDVALVHLLVFDVFKKTDEFIFKSIE